MFHLYEIEDTDFVALITQILAHRFVQFALRVGDDHGVTALAGLEDQVAGNGSGFACPARPTDSQVRIQPGVRRQCKDMPVIQFAEYVLLRPGRSGDIEAAARFFR